MSLLSRLVLLTLLAAVGLGAAMAAVLRAHGETDSAREAEAAAQSARVADELAARRDALSDQVVPALSGRAPWPPALRELAAALVRPLVDASAGYCLTDGSLVVRETVLPEDHSPLPPRGQLGGTFGPLLPLDRDVLVELCRTARGARRSQRFVAPNDLLFVTVSAGAPAAWALVRVPKRVRATESLPLAAAIALALSVLVALTLDTALKLRRGVGALSTALVAVQSDLSATIPQPEARELALVAEGLRAMTAHLAAARERELALGRRVAHAQRLASLGRVAAGVAHEIRNPLAGVKLRLDGMARRALDERSARDVASCLAEVARLDRVVSSLLLVARSEPGPAARVDVAALVDARIATFESLSAARSVVVTRMGECAAELDADGLARALDNLLRNAIEASPAGRTVDVRIETAGVDLTLSIVDRGPGVPPAREAELFEPFFTLKPDGTGLGLSLARAAVESQGGSLGYERGPDTTTFVLRLPGKARP